jgi:hypothetical protein
MKSGAPITSIALTSPAAIRADGTFALESIAPETFLLTVSGSGLVPPWSVRSAMLGDRDLLDEALDFAQFAGGGEVVIAISDRRTELSGTLVTTSGAVASDVYVIAFPTDRRFWGPTSRRVQAVRPGVDGRYVVRDLPAGDYLVAVLADVDQDEWRDTGFLDSVAGAAVKVSIAEGEAHTLDLKLGGGGL